MHNKRYSHKKRWKRRYLGTWRYRASFVFLLSLRLHGILLASLNDKRTILINILQSRQRCGIDSDGALHSASLWGGGSNDGVERCCCGARAQPARQQGWWRLPSFLCTPYTGDAFHFDTRRRCRYRCRCLYRRRWTARYATLRCARSVPAGFRVFLKREEKREKCISAEAKMVSENSKYKGKEILVS